VPAWLRLEASTFFTPEHFETQRAPRSQRSSWGSKGVE